MGKKQCARDLSIQAAASAQREDGTEPENRCMNLMGDRCWLAPHGSRCAEWRICPNSLTTYLWWRPDCHLEKNCGDFPLVLRSLVGSLRCGVTAAENWERARGSGTPVPLDTALRYERAAGREIRRALKQVRS